MKRIRIGMASLLIAAAFVQGSAGQAAAGIEWCAVDPVVHVLGSQFHIVTRTALPADAVGSVTYVLEVPSNAEGTVKVAVPVGRIPQTVEIVYTGPAYDGSGTFTVSATVTVTSDASAAVEVVVSGPRVTDTTFGGQTNTGIAARFDVAAK